MVSLSIMVEGQHDVTWARWQRLAQEVEDLGFAGLFRSDHFTNPQPPDLASLEMVVSLTYLATHTQRIHFGCLVAPLSFRDPIMLARQASAIDDLSGGRMILGLGAGWQEREHHMFNYSLADVPTRMARLEEGLEITTRLLRDPEPVTFDGNFYQLRAANLLPHPTQPGGPRILIGGNGKQRTLSLAARYADIWNGVFISPDAFKERSAILDTMLPRYGRQPQDVKRTLMHGLTFGETMEQLDKKLNWRHDDPTYANLSLEEAIEKMNNSGRIITGTPNRVAQQINTFAQAGVEELMLQWMDLDDISGLRALAKAVL